MASNSLKPITNSAGLTYSTLDAVDEGFTSQSILVRLLHSWEARDFKRNNALISQDCLLVDEKASAIQASIPPRRLYKFRNKLEQGSVFLINSFDVKSNPNSYRLTDHAFKISFNDHTSMDVENIEGDKIPHEYYRMASYKDIQTIIDKGQNLPDIVAQLTCIRTTTKLDDTKTPPKSSFNLTLTCIFESGETGFVSVWDKRAYEIRDELENIEGEPVVIIVTGVNPRTLFGQTYLNTTSSTRFFFNKDNQITKEFQKSTTFQKSLVPSIVDGSKGSIPTDTQSIEEILAFVNNNGAEEKLFWCKAKVVDVLLGNGWFFIACAGCKFKMTNTGDVLTCANCPPKKAIAILRYRIEVVVDDDCQTTTFVIFDKAAQTILKTTASDLAAKNGVVEDDDTRYNVPQVIQDIVGNVYLFHVKVTEYNFSAKNQSFRVTEIAQPTETKKSSVIGTKKRSKSCESSRDSSSLGTIALRNSTVLKKTDIEIPTIKKRRSSRKNKGQIIIEESEDDGTGTPNSDRELEDED